MRVNPISPPVKRRPVIVAGVVQAIAKCQNSNDQEKLSKDVWTGQFGTDPKVLHTLAKNLTVFTDPMAQRIVARAINDGQFGADPGVLQELAKNLAVFTDPEAQELVARAIRAG